MPRKGVPGIDGCLCEIKEKLKALYDRTHACILRINGKTPDGNGDITLDLSDAIPGRYVESVNGQDGNVIIDKASVGLSNVDNVSSSQILNQADANNQSRLEAFEAAKLDPVELEVTANSGRIIQLEGQQVVLDDKMEQTIQYVDAIGDDVAEIKDAYVDKTTMQYITGKKFIPTPAAGENSGIAVNKAYVESTDGVTNNLVHRTGNENLVHQSNMRWYATTTSGSNRWREIYKWNGRFIGVVRVLSSRIQINDIVMYGRDERYLKWGAYHQSDSELNPRLYQNDDGSYSLWMKIRASDNTLAQIIGDYIGEIETSTTSKSAVGDIPGTLIRELVD